MKDPVRPNRGKLASIDVREEVAEGAAHELVGGQRAEAISTQPPPAMPMQPPKHLRGPAVVVPRLQRAPAALPEPSSPTMVGLAPVPPPREQMTTQEVTTETLLQEAAERGAKLRAAEAAIAAKDAELAAKREQARTAEAEAAELRKALDVATRHAPAAVPVGPTEKQRRKAAMHAAVLKAVVALAGALGAATTYLAVHSATVLPPKVESVDARTKVVETAADSGHETQLRMLDYLRAEQARRECLDSQMASALARGTGHRVSGPSNSVEWVESAMPTRRPALLWDRAVWFPASPCAAATRVP